jgi:hypothetical protein
MANKKNRTRKKKSKIKPIQQTTRVPGKTAGRKIRTVPKAKTRAKDTGVKAAPKSESQQKSAGVNRSEGIRLFKVAGRPSKEDFIAVYGAAGPRMTWDQRAAAGVPANKFQAALAAKQSER